MGRVSLSMDVVSKKFFYFVKRGNAGLSRTDVVMLHTREKTQDLHDYCLN